MTRGTILLSVILAVATGACGSLEPKAGSEELRKSRERALAQRLKQACSSPATYDRLKQVAFEEAIRIRNADPVNLDRLETYSFVRVENPVVKSHDDKLDVTVCNGRFVLTVPPGAEKAFDGKQQIAADIEYAAQAAADGSGLVYQIKGAEPIIYRLAAFDLKAQSYRPPVLASAEPGQQDRPSSLPASPSTVPVAATTDPEPVPPPVSRRSAPAPTRTPVAVPAKPTVRPTSAPVYAAPSFDCRKGRSRSERMVCGSASLAALDRSMSSRFYAELDRGDARVRAALRQSRDRFLAYRERCPTEACVRQAYLDRIDEIADIARR